MNILAISGHPHRDSFCNSLLESYVEGARQGGAEVKVLYLDELKIDFLADPRHYEGAGSPAVRESQEAIAWADHVVFVYPTWWGTFPALLKGFIDQVFTPHFAYKYEKSPFQKKLLVGKTGRLIVTMDSPLSHNRWVYAAAGIVSIKTATLKFCGISPVKVRQFGMVKLSSPARRTKWLKTVREDARRDARSWSGRSQEAHTRLA